AYRNIRRDPFAVDDLQKAIKLSQDKPEFSQVKDDATKQLKEIQPRLLSYIPGTVDPIPANQTIYLHYKDHRDFSTLDKIAAALNRQLKQSNYKVARRYELITQPTNGDVRYFHQEDEGSATRIKEIVEATLKASRIEKTIELRPLLRLGRSVPQGWI